MTALDESMQRHPAGKALFTQADIDAAFEAGRAAQREAVGLAICELADWARRNDAQGDECLEMGDHSGAQRAYGARDAFKSIARMMREATS